MFRFEIQEKRDHRGFTSMPHASQPQASVTANVRPRLRHARTATLAMIVAVTLGASSSTWAHHSFSMFDTTQTVSLEGTVKEFQWTNPHVWVELIVETPAGLKQYSIEAFNVRTMRDAGWRYDTLNPGDKITLVMNPLRSGAAGGSFVSAKLPDGRTMKVF
jgi:hypothetical protein